MHSVVSLKDGAPGSFGFQRTRPIVSIRVPQAWLRSWRPIRSPLQPLADSGRFLRYGGVGVHRPLPPEHAVDVDDGAGIVGVVCDGEDLAEDKPAGIHEIDAVTK